ncbi:MAG: amino acid permease [Propionibacteriales bacterium]|nr:amino acid permease [Propionibacteriales bacterium]
MGIGDLGKRLLVGRKLRSTQLRHELLPKRIALPVFASDPLSSVAYSPDQIFLMLSLAGIAAYTVSWEVAIAIVFVMLVVVVSYRQNVQAYQSGGGDYEVTTTNLGSKFGLTVASALLVDYVLTVAVSISSFAQYVASGIPAFEGYQAQLAVGAVLFLTAVNLRGVRESGLMFAVPVYLFMVAILGMAAIGFLRYLGGDLPVADTAGLRILPQPGFEAGFAGLGAAFVILRAFAAGCATLTGVEAIANGVPAFRKPKGRNAATTLLVLGLIAVTMAISVVALANLIDVRVAEDPATQLVQRDGEPVGPNYHQDPLITQIAKSVFSEFEAGLFLVIAATGAILMLAANTAFNGFPVLGSILARDGYLPRQLHTRGDRLAYSNGILTLAGLACILIIALDASVTRLIQIYIVGVFVAFTLSQTGMVRHWTRLLGTETDARVRRTMTNSRRINALGAMVTGTVLLVVLVTKFTQGAWIAIVAMVGWFALMRAIRRHYDRVTAELEVEEADQALPSRVHAVVLVSRLHKPTIRALAYARAGKANVLEAVTVDVDPEVTKALMDEWDRLGITVPLKVLASPYREVSRPIIDYVRRIRRASPRDVVTVYVPEYVVGHWWEQVLHNQSVLRLKTRLLFMPGVMVTSVPYQLRSSAAAIRREQRVEHAPGEVRRGAPEDTE